ncbi:uncharacterized protein [Drosophila kikkawai]|uniref:Uncharacterized protein n=1 Tax=Drosophila kikkawai TaxID=30033 RepID=A0A6P4ISG4_DROKI|nr:uncharacterized protein LOC108077526 [Drosophila kikkawai]
MKSLRCKILQVAVMLMLAALQLGAEHLDRDSDDCGCGRRG